MLQVRQYLRADATCPFAESFVALRDGAAKARIDTAVRKLGRGLKPDVKSVGEGVHEARIDYGPGYRVYFGNDGDALIVLLVCGDKTTQTADIVRAHGYWQDYRERKRNVRTPPDPPLPRGTRQQQRRS